MANRTNTAIVRENVANSHKLSTSISQGKLLSNVGLGMRVDKENYGRVSGKITGEGIHKRWYRYAH